MMSEIFPILAPTRRIGRERSEFLIASKIVTVHAPRKLITQLLEICDGSKPLKKVIEILSLEWKPQPIRKLVNRLRKLTIITDVLAQSEAIWPYVENPTRFTRRLNEQQIRQLVIKAAKRHNQDERKSTTSVERCSGISRLLTQRRSTRIFATKSIDTGILGRLVWAAYGVTEVEHAAEGQTFRRTVPSAGALYPLFISLVLMRPTDGMPAGIYHARMNRPYSISFEFVHDSLVEVERAFADQLALATAAGTIIISGSFRVAEEKYGNRALLYVPIEAGHVAQNIHLASVESGLGSVEIGGFLERDLTQALRLPRGFTPLSTVLFGFPAEDQPALEDEGLEVEWAPPSAGQYRLPFSMAFARLQKRGRKQRDWSCGRALNPRLAHRKATAEAEEWAASGRIQDAELVRARMVELASAVDPCKLVRFHPAQYRKPSFPFRPFDPYACNFWEKGIDVFRGREIFILADCIFFPYRPGKPTYTNANSSGAAAHPSWDEALKHATLELIERDAFMIAWLNRLAMPIVPLTTLPDNIKQRINQVVREGFRVRVLDFSLDAAPVIFILAQSDRLHFSTGAAAASFDTTDALDHALMEVESAIFCRLMDKPGEAIAPHKVRFTHEHGRLYEQKRYFRNGNFLWSGTRSSPFTTIGRNLPQTWPGLLRYWESQGHDLLAVNLPVNPQTGLSIVKAFVPGLIPISFGYGEEPLGMERIYQIPVALGFRRKPLGYQELYTFPHLYT